MKIEVNVDLLIEAYCGLKAFGGEAVEDTAKQLEQLITENCGKDWSNIPFEEFRNSN